MIHVSFQKIPLFTWLASNSKYEWKISVEHMLHNITVLSLMILAWIHCCQGIKVETLSDNLKTPISHFGDGWRHEVV